MTRLALVCLVGIAGSSSALADPGGSSCSTSSSGSSSSSSSGSSSGGSSSSGDDSSSTPTCHDRSSIVGERRCHGYQYGRGWDVTRKRAVTLSLEAGGMGLRLRGIRVQTSSEHFDNRYGIDLGDLGRHAGFVLRPRLTVFASRHVYVGVQAAIGGAPSDESFEQGTLDIRVQSIMQIGAELIAGVAFPVGRWQLSAEIAAGGRALLVNLQTQHRDCVNDLVQSYGQWTVSARVGLDFFRSGGFSVGGYAGYDPFRRETQAGLRITAHSRAFDAQTR